MEMQNVISAVLSLFQLLLNLQFTFPLFESTIHVFLIGIAAKIGIDSVSSVIPRDIGAIIVIKPNLRKNVG